MYSEFLDKNTEMKWVWNARQDNRPEHTAKERRKLHFYFWVKYFKGWVNPLAFIIVLH